MERYGVYLKPVTFLPDSVRRRTQRSLAGLTRREESEMRALGQQVRARRAEYRKALAQLMGSAGARRYRDLRNELAGEPRSRRLRSSRKLLDEIGFDRAPAARLRATYSADVRKLLSVGDARPAPRHVPPLDECSPWVTYTPPYHGWRWSYVWHRSDEADDPVLARYLDSATGRIGSSIKTRLSGADDDDAVDVEYYTGLSVWHTTLGQGQLEGYIAFEFRTSTYSGQVRDEFGFSDATFSQWAKARLVAVDAQGPTETTHSIVFNYIDVAWGEDKSWDRIVFRPGDIHWYYFRTTAGFEQGRAVILEAGIQNVTWFTANDQSITTADDLDLRLERIMVRTCPGPIIL